jgi:hypothetical protein
VFRSKIECDFSLSFTDLWVNQLRLLQINLPKLLKNLKKSDPKQGESFKLATDEETYYIFPYQ